MQDVPSVSSLVGTNEPQLFRQWMFSHTEGRVLTLIEALGFDEKREQAVKSQFRQEIWRLWQEGMMPDNLRSKIKEWETENIENEGSSK